MTKRHEDRNEAVQNDLMKEQDSRMPINVERQSRVTFGGTKKKFYNIDKLNRTGGPFGGRYIRRNNYG